LDLAVLGFAEDMIRWPVSPRVGNVKKQRFPAMIVTA